MSGKPQSAGSLALQSAPVIVIPAANRPDAQKLRVAAYCRVSSDSADQMNSFAAQRSHYNTLISGKENWLLADLYADAGVTGTSADKRPEFQRLLSDCRQGRIDKVLCKSISRFARNTRECLEAIRELKALGVGVLFEEQNIDTGKVSGELLTATFAAIAQKESQSISENMRWSYRQRMESGRFLTCKAPFGYRLIEGKLEIYEPEARVVRSIFQQYLSGKSIDEIAAYVNTLGFPTRDGNLEWKYPAISYILHNERYAGDALLQKRYTTDTLPYRERRNHGEKQQYFLPESHPAIVNRETFQAAANLLERRAQPTAYQTHEQATLALTVVCGHCGAYYKRRVCNGITYWVCKTHFQSKAACPALRIPEEEIHAGFLRIYHKLRLHGEPILRQLLRDLQSVREKRLLWSVDIVELNKKISYLHHQDRKLAQLNAGGLVDPDIFIAQSSQLAAQLTEAKQQKARLLTEGQDEVIPQTRELLETLESLPEYLPAFDGEIFHALIDRITVEGNTLRFRLKNRLELTETVQRRPR